jgi:hypothetical protein
MRARRIAHVLAAVAAAVVAVEVPVSEFVELQRLSNAEIRRRFDLAESCQPAIAAVRGLRTGVVVLVSCLEGGNETPDDDERRPAKRRPD